MKQQFSRYKNLYFGILLSIILTAGISACLEDNEIPIPTIPATRYEPAKSPTSNIILTLENHTSVLSVRDYWSLAMTEAYKWRADSYIHKIDIDVNISSDTTTRSIGYYVKSPSETSVSLGIECNFNGCRSWEIKHSDKYPVIQCKPITLNDFNVDSQEFLRLFLTQGEIDIRNKNIYSLMIFLSRDNPGCDGKINWRGSALNVNIDDSVTIIVDAVTGEFK